MGSIKNTCPEPSPNIVLGGCSPDFATIKAIALVDDPNAKLTLSNEGVLIGPIALFNINEASILTIEQWEAMKENVSDRAKKIELAYNSVKETAEAIVSSFEDKKPPKQKSVWRNGKLRTGNNFKHKFYSGK